jgi:CHAT domain-containing protein/WD40 domain-containing protein
MRFRLEIGDGDGAYPVTARAPDGRTARGSLRLPWSPDELDRLLQRMADAVVLSSAAIRRDPTAYESVVQQVAGPLFEALPEGVRELLTRWLEQATRRTVVLLVRPPELARLPWEFLYDPAEDDYLFLNHSLIRHLPVRTVQRPLLAHRPLQILGIVGSAGHIDVDKERQQLEEAVAELRQTGQVELEWVDHQPDNGRQRGSGWHELTQTIEFGQQQWHVVHFIGHGKWDGDEGEGALLLEGEPGSDDAYTMPASRLANRLRARPSIRLVVLNACHTGEPDSRDTFSSVAGALIRRGIPAAVGMQFPVTDPAAIAFSRSFYYGLAHNRSVQDAVTLARRDINDALKGSMEWGTPVLYVHDPDRPVFDVRPTGVRWSPKRIASIDAPHPVNAVAFSPDSGWLALACDRHEPLLVEAGRWLPPPPRRLRTSLYAAAFSPDGGWLASAGLNEAVVIWETGSGRPVPPAIRHPDWVPDVAVSPAGVLATACGDGVVRFWRVQLDPAPAHELLRTLPRHRETVRAVCFDATGERLATACDDRLARIWRVDDQPPPPIELPHPAPVVGVAFSRNGKLLATACEDRYARIWDIDRGSPTGRLPHRGPVLGVAFSPDGRLLATASMDRTVRVWDLEATGSKPVLTIEHARPVRRVVFSPDGQWLATASFDRSCQVWQFATEKRESA